VASGLKNREVAAQLFMSPKTVEATLARVYRKLEIHSRAELGARLGPHEFLQMYRRQLETGVALEEERVPDVIDIEALDLRDPCGPVTTAASASAASRCASRTSRSNRGRGLSHQKMMFVEEGKGVRDVIATTRKRRGKIRFHPASGPRGRRAIAAIVTRQGVPRAQMTVAHYKAPGPLLPGRPRHVRLRRRGSKLVVRWKAAPRARRYAVAWALRDGRHQAKIVRRHRLRIRRVPGIEPDGSRSPACAGTTLPGQP
jgi:hypothetical protein